MALRLMLKIEMSPRTLACLFACAMCQTNAKSESAEPVLNSLNELRFALLSSRLARRHLRNRALAGAYRDHMCEHGMSISHWLIRELHRGGI